MTCLRTVLIKLVILFEITLVKVSTETDLLLWQPLAGSGASQDEVWSFWLWQQLEEEWKEELAYSRTPQPSFSLPNWPAAQWEEEQPACGCLWLSPVLSPAGSGSAQRNQWLSTRFFKGAEMRRLRGLSLSA